jgi:hypothetical protein
MASLAYRGGRMIMTDPELELTAQDEALPW